MLWDKFPKHKRLAYGYDTRCLNCFRDYQKGLREAHKSAPPKPDCCDICNLTDTKLFLDHCHETGKVRGWLCGQCNRGIGLFHDSIEELEKAIHYLSK